MLRPAARLAPLFVFACLLDCTSFAPLPANTCGNAVVDANEDCDTFARGATACRPPGAVGACRFDCEKTPCPSGYGCGVDNICRQASGRFARMSAQISAGASRFLAGDFDGDRRVDLVSREPLDPFGVSRLRIHFFDSTASLTKTLIVPPAVGSPKVVDANGDKRADLVFSEIGSFGNPGGVGMMLGEVDRTLSAVAFPAFPTFPGTARVVGAFSVAKSTVFILYAKDAKGAMLALADPAGDPVPLTALPTSPDPGKSNIATGVFFPKSCGEAVLALPKATEVLVFPLCDAGGALNMQGASDLVHVALPSGITVDGGVVTGDANGDGLLDILVGGKQNDVPKTFVAYGTTQRGFASTPRGAVDNKASIFRLNLTTMEDFEPGLPLAVGDTNNDGRPDFVTPDKVLTSIRGSGSTDGGADGGATALTYFIAGEKLQGTWTDAVIADFNANGYQDVIAGSSKTLDLDFFNGNGTEAFSKFSLTTNGPTSAFSVADVDGDYVPDLVFSQTATDHDQLSIAYGRVGGPPNAPVVVGDFPRIVQTLTYDPGAPVANVIVVDHPVDPKQVTTSISVLAGTGDRNPLALFGLTHPKVATGIPFGVLPGAFTKPGNVDVVAVAADIQGGEPTKLFRLWLAKAGAAAGTKPTLASVVDGPALPDDASLVVQTETRSGIALLMAAGDVDGDGTPEIVAVTPKSVIGDGANSQLVVAKARSDDKAFDVSTPIALGVAASPEAQLELVDVDRDGALDVVLLSGAHDASKLVVYWNDGHGGFDAQRSNVLSRTGDVPRGFTFVNVDAKTAPALAYVTAQSVVLSRLDARTVGAQDAIDSPKDATGIIAADVDGDGVDDLAVADSGNIVILLAQAVLK